jgi:glycosyltransferase involved in cell wall biosynthesis
MPRTILFIPMYNCQEQIQRVTSKIDNEIINNIDEILLVDNNSTDITLQNATAGISQLDCKVTIIQNEHNYNLGGSIKNAILYSIKNKYDYLIVLHGDDQADIQDLKKTLKSKSFVKYDMTIGSRFHPDSILMGYSWFRSFGNRVFNYLFSIVVGKKVYDMIAGLNIYNLSIFENREFLNFPNNLTFDAHLLLFGFHNRFKIDFIPISWRDEDQVSNARVFKQAKIILKLLVGYVFKRETIFNKTPEILEKDFSYKVVFEKDKN